jgi:hypothetical protein
VAGERQESRQQKRKSSQCRPLKGEVGGKGELTAPTFRTVTHLRLSDKVTSKKPGDEWMTSRKLEI